MARLLYNFLIYLFYFPFVLIIFLRRIYGKEHQEKFKEKIFKKKFQRPSGFLFWFHVASIGELNSILPIVEFFLKKNIKSYILITTITLSSYNQIQKKYGNEKRIFHQFLPYDINFLVNNFFENWKPDIVSFVDSEIWPNFIFKIKGEKIPFLLLNARLTKKTFTRWKVVKSFAQSIFSSFSLAISSNKETIDYLNYFNTKQIKYFGNIKFCSSIDFDNQQINKDLNSISQKMWCALSIHPGEEIFCGNVQKILKNKFSDSLAIIIPRHTHKIKNMYKNLKKLGFNVQIKSENDKIEKTAAIVIVNYYGSTLKYLKNINNVFIGKSLLSNKKNDGGQNPIDAAKLGCNIYHGPYVNNFKEIYKYLDNENISEQIQDPEIFAEKLIDNLQKSHNKNKENVEKIHIYSKEIFNGVIDEYQKLIK